ncbi:MAG: hypothetical protein ING36_03645 [Burkholderiales bacterium]|nr:hypothetical protein [Burkholderiales bacterium]
MSNTFYTENLSEILGFAREREMVRDILNAWGSHGLPIDFDDDGVKIGFNKQSGNVFLVNSDYQCCMVSGCKLESFYFSPYHGIEGFFDEIVEQYATMHPEDQEWLRDVAKNIGRLGELPALEESEA